MKFCFKFGVSWAWSWRPTLGWEICFGVNLRNWALPLAFGTGIWSDEECGDYGVVYSCEYFHAAIVNLLCFRLRVDWPVSDRAYRKLEARA